MRFDDDLKNALIELAEAENRSLTNFIETEMRKVVAKRKPAFDADIRKHVFDRTRQ